MVMHARKPQRLNDGYFDKHQSHQYQNSKYSSKRDYEREASSRSTNYGRDRDISPVGSSVINGNSYRSVSPELDSPRDRDRDRDRDRGGERYQSVYMQKMRDKDRERDYKKDKYSDCLRSPKEKRSRGDRDEHRTNHDRRSKLSSVSEKRGGSSSNSDDRDRDRDRERERNDRERDRDRGERDRVNRIGDWSEHVSSSGKKYYYNCKTEVSQWEKPREWIDKERTLQTKEHRDYREKERDRERTDRDRERERDDRYMSTNRSSYSKHSNSKNNSRMKWTRPDEGPPTSHRRRHDDNQDMDISPDSTPTSEASYSHSSTPTIQQAHNTNNNSNNDGPVLLANARLVSNPQQMSTSSMQHPHYPMQIATSSPSVMQQQHLISSGHQPSDIMLTSNTPGPPNQSGGSSLTAGQSSSTNMAQPSSAQSSSSSSLAGLPKILSQITGNKTIEPNELNPQKALQTINNALLMNSRQQMSDLGNSSNLREKTLNSPLYNISHLSHGLSTSIMNHNNQNNGISQTNQLISGDGSDFHGPPTPTQELDLINDHRKLEGTTSTVSSLHSVMTSSQAGRPQGPNLTPSLANYFRADLIAHVTGWPSEMLEKNVQKLSEEAHILGDLQCSKVSTELKCARSLVRITEITATLQEQKIMYLRQQIRRLEELRTQNSFMSSDEL